MKSPIRRARWILHLIVSLTSTLVAAENQSIQADTNPTPAWTVDDLISIESAGGWRISPDCHWAVWVKSVPDKDKGEYVGNLFLSSLTNHQEIQLTKGRDGCNSPKWSPDGQLIAFLSSQSNPKAKAADKGKTQIWLMNPFGGEPWALTYGGRAVYAFHWADNGNIIYSAQAAPSVYEQTKREKKDSAQVVEDDANEPPVRLFKVELKSAEVTRLTENGDRILNFWVSPDGAQVVTIHARNLRSSYDQSLKPVTFLTNLKTGERKQIFTDAKYNLLWPVSWQLDSRGFYAGNARTSNPKYSHPAIYELYRYTLPTDRIEKVDLAWDKALDTADLQVTDGGFVTLLADGVRPRPARYSFTNGKWRREWITGIHATNLFGFQFGKDEKTFLYCYSTPTSPSQLYRATLNGAQIESPVQLTDLSPQLRKKQMAEREIVHWKGALGETVEGLLFYPLGFQSGKKYPLVVDIHGGPADAFLDTWWPTILNNNFVNAQGAFVFRPNYHGSTGYGLKWVESNVGKFTKIEVEDINKGVDRLIERGLVDPEKLAINGWSSGGTLVAAVTVNTKRYKAAIAGDCPIEFIDYWAKSDFGAAFCGGYFGKTPLDDPATLMRHSPFYQMSKVTTPTLILFGVEDRRVPVEQGWMYYRALQQGGKAEARLVLFPGEGHWYYKLTSLRRTLEEQTAWLDKYLFKNGGSDISRKTKD